MSPPAEADATSRAGARGGEGRGPEKAQSERAFQVQAEEAGERLDKYLAERVRLSRTRVAELIGAGEVRVNAAAEKKSYPVEAGDRIRIRIPEPEPIRLEPQALPVEILYEDEELAVVEKPEGMVVHPAPGHSSGTLVNALLHHLDRLSSVGTPNRPGIVHRLDKDTSGLLVVAKNEQSHRKLARALSRRQFDRGYVAAAWGHLDEDRVTVDRPIGRSSADRRKMAVTESGRPAVTHLRRVERWRSADLVAVKLETGRTHQIRVHLLDLGHPVVGDPLYAEGWEKGFVGEGGHWARELGERCGRMFLHAARLVFRHPRTGEELAFTSELPEPLSGAVQWARATS